MSLPEYINLYTKKAYFYFVSFNNHFRRIPLGKKIGAAFLILAISLYPGENTYQTLQYNEGLPVLSAYDYEPPSYFVNDGTNAPDITAESAIVLELNTGTILYKKKPDTVLLPASTTKLMTVLVANDIYNQNDVLRVRNQTEVVGQALDAKKDEEFVYEDVIKAVLIHSANDMALVLAENYQNGYQAFVDRMNQKARELNMNKTNYSNVSGIESLNHRTTAFDLSLLAREFLNHSSLVEITALKSTTISALNTSNIYPLTSTNLLLDQVEGIIGLKTGWTENAGECLITATQRDGHTIVTVVLNSKDRFGETKKLIDWSFNHHSQQR